MSAIIPISNLPTSQKVYKYQAFISYKRDPDLKIAEALQSALHRIGRPWYKPYAVRVFRDKTDVELSHKLWGTIQQGLEQSEYLILLASPQATQSHWVQKEIEWWVNNRSLEKLLIILTNGEIVWGEQDYDWQQTTSLPQLLNGKYTEVPSWLDLSWARTSEDLSLRQPQFKEAAAILSARLQGKEKADVISEDVKQYRRTRKLAWSAVTVLFLLTIMAASTAVFAFQQQKLAIQQRDLAEVRRVEAERANEAERKATQVAEDRRKVAESATEAEKKATEKAEERRKEAAQQAKIAEQQKQEAEKQTIIANQQTQEAIKARDGAEHLSYNASMNLATREFAEGKYLQGYEHLNSFLPPSSTIRDHRDFLWYHLWKENHQELRTLKRLSANELFGACSSDGKIVAVINDEGEIRLWHLGKDKDVLTLPEKASSIFEGMAISGNGKFLAVNQDSHISVWDIENRQRVKTLEDEAPAGSMAFSPDGKTLATADIFSKKTIRLWDIESGKNIGILDNKTIGLSIAFSLDGKLLAFGGGLNDDDFISIWDLASRRVIHTLKGNDKLASGPVLSLAFSPDGKALAIGGTAIRLWDITSGQLSQPMKGHSRNITSLTFSNDMKNITSGSLDGTLKLWEVADTSDSRAALLKYKTPGLTQAFSKNGRWMASGGKSRLSNDKEKLPIAIWDMNTGRTVRTLLGQDQPYPALAFSANGELLASGSDDKTIKLWDMGSGLELQTLKGHTSGVVSVAFGYYGKVLASGSWDNTVKLWEIPSGRMLHTLNGHEEGIISVAVSYDERIVASLSSDKSIMLWDVKSGQLLNVLQGHKVENNNKKDDQTSVGVDNTATIPSFYLAIYGSVIFSKDGKTLASASDDMTIKLWDVRSGRELRTLKGHVGNIASLAFSPNGRMLASGDVTGEVKLWDVLSGLELQSLKLHKSTVGALEWSEDGMVLVSGSKEGETILWRTATETEVWIQAGIESPKRKTAGK